MGAYAKGFCQSFDTSLEVGGGCIHTIQRGRGVFKKADGVITFIDVIAGVADSLRNDQSELPSSPRI